MKKIILIIVVIIAILGIGAYYHKGNKTVSFDKQENEGGIQEKLHPLSIEYMKKQTYEGSDIVIEQTLSDGSNYKRYVVSYRSDGLKIYALLTVPSGAKPATGWPVIIFNHGYIPPAAYRTTERYVAYMDAFSRNGYIVFKSDYRGHGNSEGNPEGAYYSPAYTIDILNAVSSIKRYREADREKIGMWGHSMGGSITLRSMVVSQDIKVGVIWAGVVGSYEDMLKNWRRSRPWMPSQREQVFRRPGRQELIEKYGDTDKNPDFWQSISPIYHVEGISGQVQIHHGLEDEQVPVLFSEKLHEALKNAGKTGELYTYPGDDHNISANLNTALQRSVEFFDKYLK
ncbi:MAG TPA: alpha/beta fold hydrolase [Patescibacteria group bacterium]|nr:alpha/beta fold hydrolase [Patescibacteria group bacterium]